MLEFKSVKRFKLITFTHDSQHYSSVVRVYIRDEDRVYLMKCDESLQNGSRPVIGFDTTQSDGGGYR